MILDWKYNVETKIAAVDIVPGLRYETPDGGQTINKFVDGEIVETFHKFGPENKFTGFSRDSTHGMQLGEYFDEWPDEVSWLAAEYPEAVGPLISDWDLGFLEVDGEIRDVGKRRGMGVVSPDKPVSINRICQPAWVQEWWGWEQIARTDKCLDEACHGIGMRWMRNKETGEIVRVGNEQPQVPCCVFPTMHGPYKVDSSDIALHDGQLEPGITL
jgi:hypothetical protein